ncbi:MAG: hypothetical protein ACXAEU_15885 [Candidatus Hodarchaeales archaeon]|jgi:hypothetical protein
MTDISLFRIEGIITIITVIITFLFLLSVTSQFVRKRQSHHFVWVTAILMFTVTVGTEGLSFMLGYWDPLLYKLYYVLAAVQVSILGAGTLYLFANKEIINDRNSGLTTIIFGIVWTFFSLIYIPRSPIFVVIFVPALLITLFGVLYPINLRFRVLRPFKFSGMRFAHVYFLFTVAIFALMCLTATNAPVNEIFLSNSEGHEVSGLPWQVDPNDPAEPRAVVRLFSPLLTVPGSVALIGGTFYSYGAWQWAIKKKKGHLEPTTGLFNVFIGVGGLILAAGGALSGFGVGVLYVSELVAITLMYFGFLESDKISMEQLINVLTLGLFRKKASISEHN